MVRVDDEPDLADVARPPDQPEDRDRADDLPVLDGDRPPGRGLHPILEDARVVDVLLEERPVAFGNALKEARQRRAVAVLDRSNLHAAPRSARLSLWSMIQAVSFGIVCLNADLPVPNVTWPPGSRSSSRRAGSPTSA